MGLGLIRTRLSQDNCLPFRHNLKKPKNHQRGWGGGQFVFVLLESSNLCDLGAHAKVWNPMTTRSGMQEKKREKINTKNNGLPKLLHWSQALRSDQNPSLKVEIWMEPSLSEE